jgi:hypothetical protein
VVEPALLGAFLRMPLLTAGVMFRIHWQALKLWLKGVPFRRRPLVRHDHQPLQESTQNNNHDDPARQRQRWPATRALVLALLEKLQGGLLEVRLPDGSSRLFGEGEHGVTLQVHDEAMFSQVSPAATSAWPKPTSTATGIHPT